MERSPLDQIAQMSFNLALGEGTDQFVYLPAILEEKKGGDTLDTVLRSNDGIVIRVQFGDLDPSGIL